MRRREPNGLMLLHLTDGSPRDLADAKAAGFSSRESYAAARREELNTALTILGLPPSQCLQFSFVDKDLYLRLKELVVQMTCLIEQIRPSLVLTPAYEGGHPDHDSAALAVAIARARHGFRHREYRLYHSGPDGSMSTKDFLPCGQHRTQVLRASHAERELKSRMLESFRTQKHVLRHFETEAEQFRDAPTYDFRSPPHEGPLLYERWGFAISGAEWRARASECL
ncbi:MAG: LmbE-like protein [Bryobacterales bacterium]|nr:LmbE-like protein [Bryobacterales bacterium]